MLFSKLKYSILLNTWDMCKKKQTQRAQEWLAKVHRTGVMAKLPSLQTETDYSLHSLPECTFGVVVIWCVR